MGKGRVGGQNHRETYNGKSRGKRKRLKQGAFMKRIGGVDRKWEEKNQKERPGMGGSNNRS